MYPIVLDAMIQTYAFKRVFAKAQLQKGQLVLPVGIRKFPWFSIEPTPVVYAYTTWDDSTDEGTGDVRLYSDQGILLGLMEGIQLMTTSDHSFLRALRAEETDLPEFMHEIWKLSEGFT